MSQHNDLIVRVLKGLENTAANATDKAIQDGFAEGRAYRINYRDTIVQNGEEIVLRYDNAGDTVLALSTLEVQQGGVSYEIYTADNVTEDTPFSGSDVAI